MKSTLLLFCLFFCTQNYAMDILAKEWQLVCAYNIAQKNNFPVGPLDTLMLSHAVSQEGYDIIKQKIVSHQFIINISPKTDAQKPNPYCIRYYCNKNDESELAKELYRAREEANAQELAIKIHKRLNNQENAIDHGTSWEFIDNSSDIEFITYFFNQQILLTELMKLRK